MTDDVTFNFLTDGEAETLRGSVLERNNEMVIDVQADDDNPAYVIVGRHTGDFFAGVNSSRDDDAPDVIARWALLGDLHVGAWIEDGIEYLFSFRLPPHR